MVWTGTRSMSTFSTFSFSLPLTGQVASESISLEIPVDIVPDSSKAYVTVLGDVMGTALQNLEQSGTDAKRLWGAEHGLVCSHNLHLAVPGEGKAAH